jgi:hypothetical protein
MGVMHHQNGRAGVAKGATEMITGRVSARSILLAATLLLFSACESVSYVDQVVIVNDTSYTAGVDVRGKDSEWVALATVEAGETRDVGQVIDQGELWIFRFAYLLHDPVDIEISRKELVDAKWHVEVPAGFEDGLREEGVIPPP